MRNQGITFTIIIILVILLLSLNYKQEWGTKTIDMVIARYNEDLGWLHKFDISQIRTIYIYNKGPNTDFFHAAPNIKVISLPNVGRESHTYLFHIITQYEHLGDVTVFLPGSANEESDRLLRNKWYRATRTFDQVMTTRDSVFVGQKVNDLKAAEYDFVLDDYQSATSVNREMNPEYRMKLSPIRPFGKWFEHYFGDISVPVITYTGIFAVSRAHIYNRTKEFYQDIQSTIDDHSNVEVAHYLERAYVALFHPIPSKHIYYDDAH
jgi:hypothetical protein